VSLEAESPSTEILTDDDKGAVDGSKIHVCSRKIGALSSPMVGAVVG
jgi:hypothetical protein